MSAERVPAAYHRDAHLQARGPRPGSARAGASSSRTSPREPRSRRRALALGARIYVGQWSWRDVLPPLALLAAQPFVEWVIHKYLLHLRRSSCSAARIELYGSIQHRNHHLAPSDLDRVLLKPIEVVSFLVQIAIVIALITARRPRCRSGGRSSPLALTGITFAYLGLLRYEWSHFLIHTPYVPRTRWYRDDLAQPPPAPLQARGLLDGRQLEPRRPRARDQSRSAVGGEVADRADAGG